MLSVNDYKSKSYIDVFDAFDALDVSLRYGSDSWKKVFSGPVSTAQPRLSARGEVLDVAAWGEGNCLAKTHCDTTYGVESQNTTKDTVREILQDLVTNYVNKTFGGGASGWSLDNSKVEILWGALSITHLPGMYQSNFVMVNRVCDIANAYAQGLGSPEVSMHWYVDPSAYLYAKKIDQDHSDGNWDRYWGGTSSTDPGTQASSTIAVTEDMILYDFRKNVEEYANNIVLHTAFRKPGWDYWAEGSSSLWTVDAPTEGSVSDDSGNYYVGADSLKCTANANQTPDFYFPSTAANWDFTKIGSQNSPPKICFYARRTANANHAVAIELWTTDSTNYFYQFLFNTASDTHLMPNDGDWYHLEFDLVSGVPDGWSSFGSPDWANIDFINVMFNNSGYAGANDFWIDDLHFAGKIVREAKDTSEISANNEYQRIVRNDTAVDDTMIESDDSGAAARLAYAELLRRSQTPIVGMIQIPLAVDLLPGQTVHIHACKKKDGTFRIDKDMRVKELVHIFALPNPVTTLNLTDDVTNSHAFAAPTASSLLIEYAATLGHSEARDLKGGGIDPLVPRLSNSY